VKLQVALSQSDFFIANLLIRWACKACDNHHRTRSTPHAYRGYPPLTPQQMPARVSGICTY